MPILRPAPLVVAGVLGVTLALPAAAQDTLAAPSFRTAPAKAKPSRSAAAASSKERRPGELEGFESGLTAPARAKPRAPADAIGERRLPDGGLPLPRERDTTPGMGQAPVGFDKNGNVGGMFKF